MDSPIGELVLEANEEALTGIHFEDGHPTIGDDWNKRPDHPVLHKARQQLAEYFAGRRKLFDLPLAPTGTVFQRKVWKALQSIPWGETQSYGDITR
ncbi:MAG: MGMT family protein, partial [Sinobacteraceae bacterium]|nr:MGMT family protein [Nevskiaceae bacterium]